MDQRVRTYLEGELRRLRDTEQQSRIAAEAIENSIRELDAAEGGEPTVKCWKCGDVLGYDPLTTSYRCPKCQAECVILKDSDRTPLETRPPFQLDAPPLAVCWQCAEILKRHEGSAAERGSWPIFCAECRAPNNVDGTCPAPVKCPNCGKGTWQKPDEEKVYCIACDKFSDAPAIPRQEDVQAEVREQMEKQGLKVQGRSGSTQTFGPP